MNDEEATLLDAARRLADGRSLDWAALERELGSSAKARIEGLRRLASLQRELEMTPEEFPSMDPGGVGEAGKWGHLVVGELLGSGSFGEVYRAYDTVLRRDVALKLRRTRPAGTHEDQFLAEARRLARVRHPNVLAVHGADVHQGRAGLWADLLAGETLEQHLDAQRRFSHQEVLGLARQLSSALQAVHGAGIVHGDVKAANIMLEPSGDAGEKVILMDFGAGSEASGVDAPATPGSPLSMAPELFTGEPPSFASDVYSVGVLLFRMLTGRYPVEAETYEALLLRHRDGSRPRWPQDDTSPRHLRRVVERLLGPKERRGSAAALGVELQEIEEAPRVRRRRAVVATVIASLLLTVVATTAGLVLARRSAALATAAQLEAERTTEFLTDLLLAPDTRRAGPEVRVLEVMDSARNLAEANTDTALRARILRLIGRVKGSLGQGEEALTILRRAEEDFASLGEAAVFERAEVVIHRATLHTEQGDVETALQLLEEVEPVIETLPTSERLRRYWLRAQAVIAHRQGRLEDGERHLRQVLESEIPGEEGEQLRRAKNNLAIVLEEGGKLDQAEALYRDLLERNLERHGERHDDTLAVRSNLAGLLARKAQHSEAEALFRENMETSRDWLGPTHLHHVLGITSLASVLAEQGRLSEALELDRRALPLVMEAWGEGHVRTLITKMNMAFRRRLAGELEEAEALLREATAGLEAAVGPSAPPLLWARSLLAQVLLDSGRVREAHEIAEDTLRWAEENLGAQSGITLTTRSRLAQAKLSLGEHGEGLALLRSSLEAQRENHSPDAPETLETQLALAAAERDFGDRGAARSLFCDAAARLEATRSTEDALATSARADADSLGGCAAI